MIRYVCYILVGILVSEVFPTHVFCVNELSVDLNQEYEKTIRAYFEGLSSGKCESTDENEVEFKEINFQQSFKEQFGQLEKFFRLKENIISPISILQVVLANYQNALSVIGKSECERKVDGICYLFTADSDNLFRLIRSASVNSAVEFFTTTREKALTKITSAFEELERRKKDPLYPTIYNERERFEIEKGKAQLQRNMMISSMKVANKFEFGNEFKLINAESFELFEKISRSDKFTDFFSHLESGLNTYRLELANLENLSFRSNFLFQELERLKDERATLKSESEVEDHDAAMLSMEQKYDELRHQLLFPIESRVPTFIKECHKLNIDLEIGFRSVANFGSYTDDPQSFLSKLVRFASVTRNMESSKCLPAELIPEFLKLVNMYKSASHPIDELKTSIVKFNKDRMNYFVGATTDNDDSAFPAPYAEYSNTRPIASSIGMASKPENYRIFDPVNHFESTTILISEEIDSGIMTAGFHTNNEKTSGLQIKIVRFSGIDFKDSKAEKIIEKELNISKKIQSKFKCKVSDGESVDSLAQKIHRIEFGI